MSEAAKTAPRWMAPLGGVLFLVLALLFQFLAQPADGWFSRLGVFAFLGVVFDFLMIFLAAFIAATPFLHRFGEDPAFRRNLTRGFCVAYWIWQALSFALLAKMLDFAPVMAGFAVFALCEAAMGAVTILAAVYLRGRLFAFARRMRLQAPPPRPKLTGKPT